MNPKRIIVIGGAHGGPRAAAAARQCDDKAQILLLEKASRVTWVQAGLRHHLEDSVGRLASALKLREQTFAKRYQVDVRTGCEVVSIDLDAGVVNTQSLGKAERVPFDVIIYSGGARSRQLTAPGLTGEFVSNFRNFNDLEKIQSAIKAKAQTAVVIGSGTTGLDAAQALRASGISVTLIEKRARILPHFSLQAAKLAEQQIRKIGVELILGDEVVGATQKSEMGFSLQLQSGKSIETDFVVVAIGQEPFTQLLGEAGAALQKDGSLRVNAQMETTLPNVFACGSAVAVPQVLTHERIWLPSMPTVERTARVAGKNAATVSKADFDALAPITAVQLISVGPHKLARTGLTESEARQFFGDSNILILTTHAKASETWAGSNNVSIVMILEVSSKTVVGAEVWGECGVERRIDLLSCAISERWSLKRLIDLDMIYEPSEGPAYDPLKQASQNALSILDDKSRVISAQQILLWVAQGVPFELLDVSQEPATPKLFGNLPVRFLPLADLETLVPEKNDARKIVACSTTGTSSLWAQQRLAQIGFDAYSLDGGHANLQLLFEA